MVDSLGHVLLVSSILSRNLFSLSAGFIDLRGERPNGDLQFRVWVMSDRGSLHRLPYATGGSLSDDNWTGIPSVFKEYSIVVMNPLVGRYFHFRI